MKHRLPRPTGAPLKMLLAELRAANKPIEFASQSRVEPGFSGFFFALTEGEIAAAEILGSRHRVALYNKPAGALLLSSVQEIVQRAKSSNWQLSVQL